MLTRRRELLLEKAFNPVDAHSGTPYPCQQRDLDIVRHHPGYNPAPRVSQRQATLEIVQHNDLRRRLSSEERDAIHRLSDAIYNAARYPWGPDLVIKSFLDLDIVFFGGALQGSIGVTWKSREFFRGHELGITQICSTPGHAQVRLNAEGILLHRDPFKTMFSTILHEMCVSSIQLKSSMTAESLGIYVDETETACTRGCTSQTS